jgi:N-acetylneuraminate synthase
VEPEDTVRFSEESGYRLCFDVSHSKLAANHAKASFHEWTEQFAARAAHLHLVDAAGVDGEGLQIGDGEIDFSVLAEQVDRLAPDAAFIPEIWQGHKNGGEDFWVALERLEAWF